MLRGQGASGLAAYEKPVVRGERGRAGERREAEPDGDAECQQRHHDVIDHENRQQPAGAGRRLLGAERLECEHVRLVRARQARAEALRCSGLPCGKLIPVNGTVRRVAPHQLERIGLGLAAVGICSDMRPEHARE